jgi:hypothetical protein
MSISKKTKDVVKEVGLMNELLEHLRQIGSIDDYHNILRRARCATWLPTYSTYAHD